MHLYILHSVKREWHPRHIQIEDWGSDNAIKILQDLMSALMLSKHTPATVRLDDLGALSMKTAKIVLDLLTNGDCFTGIRIVDPSSSGNHADAAPVMNFFMEKLTVSKRLNRLEIHSYSFGDEAAVGLAA
jgi:hypothetical protein